MSYILTSRSPSDSDSTPPPPPTPIRTTPFGVQSYRRIPSDQDLKLDYEYEITVNRLRDVQFTPTSDGRIVFERFGPRCLPEISRRVVLQSELLTLNDVELKVGSKWGPFEPPFRMRIRPPAELCDWKESTGIGAIQREKAYRGELDDEDPFYIQLQDDMKFLELDEKEMISHTKTNIAAAQEQIDVSLREKSKQVVAMECWNLLFDVSSALISIVDVVTDVLVAIQFYHNPEQRVFFILSVAIFLLAQTGYSSWFVAVYIKELKGDFCLWGDAQFFGWLFAVFPFAQFVPIFMWLDSYNFGWVNRFKSCVGLSMRRKLSYNMRIHVTETDRLRTWAKEKMCSHGGFIIEAAIEGFPQSILQMVAIVVFQRATTINVISIILSMVSVASKTIMFAYSVDKFCFIFKFLCMVLDIFNIFAILSWVFFNPSRDGISLIGQIWLWKVGLIVGMIVLWFVLFALVKLLLLWVRSTRGVTYGQICVDPCVSCFNGIRRCGRGWCVLMPRMICGLCGNCRVVDCVSQCVPACLVCGVVWVREVIDGCVDARTRCWDCGVRRCTTEPFTETLTKLWALLVNFVLSSIFFLGLIPILIGLGAVIGLMGFEIVKVSIVAFYFSHVSAKHPARLSFFKPFFEWALRSKNKDDYYLKLAVANYVIAEMRDPCFRDARCKKLTENPLEQVKPWHLREYFNYTWDDYTRVFSKIEQEFRETFEQAGVIGRAMVVFTSTFGFCLYAIVPAIFASWLLSLLFPMLAFAMTPSGKMTMLQLALTGTYLVVFVIVLCLVPRVARFQHANIHLVAARAGLLVKGRATEAFLRVRKHYANLLATRERNELLRFFFHDDRMYPMMMEFLPVVHVVDKFDEIEYLLDEETVTTPYSLFDLMF